MRRLLLILRFYRSSMLIFCVVVSLALAFTASQFGSGIIPLLLLGKAAIYPLLLYLYILPCYTDEFFYYRNLGIRRRWLLGVSCGVDFVLCWLLLILSLNFYIDVHT